MRTLRLAGSLLVLLAGCTKAPATEPVGVRVVLVTLDTLRHDALADMPLLTRRARAAARFELAFSATSTTGPTHSSLFTGLPPWSHGVVRNGFVLEEEYETVAERFAAQGFTTAAAVGSYVVSRRFGYAQGFATFLDDFEEGYKGLAEPRSPPRDEESEATTLDDDTRPKDHYYNLGEAVTRRALELLAQPAASEEVPRQFFWFHYFDAHDPYGDSAGEADPPEAVEVLEAARAEGASTARESAALAHARDLYARDVAALDRHLDRLLEALLSAGERFETHVVITADHGESLGEDGSVGHGRRLTPQQIHVPLLIFSPQVQAGERRDVAASVDVPGTLLALGSVPADGFGGRNLAAPSAAQEGRSRAFGMRRVFRRPPQDLRLDGVHRLEGNLFYAVGDDGRIYRGNADFLLPPPGAAEAAAPPSPILEKSLRQLFATFEAELESRLGGQGEAEELDPEVEEALRALGYVG